MYKRLIILFFLAGMVFTNSTVFAAQGSIEVKSIAEVDVKISKDGKDEVKRVPVKSAPPGTEVIFTTTFKNVINKSVADVVIVNPVPNGTAYKAGSATGVNTGITYSVDGGKTYGAPEVLVIKDTVGKERPALPADYTHIRWAYKGELTAGKSSNVQFVSVIK